MDESDYQQFDVFISYASEDGAFASKIAEKLRENNIKVWFDKWELKAGDHLLVSINKGIELSKKMLAIWSPNYFNDTKLWTHSETYSQQHSDLLGKKHSIIPVLLRDCNIPPTLRNIISIDFREDKNFDLNFKKILKSLDLSTLSQEVLSQITIPNKEESHLVKKKDSVDNKKNIKNIRREYIKKEWNLVKDHNEYQPIEIENILDLVAKNNKIIIHGQAGIGKTTILKEIAKIGGRRGMNIYNVKSFMYDSFQAIIDEFSSKHSYNNLILLIDSLEDYFYSPKFRNNQRSATYQFLIDCISSNFSIIITARTNLIENIFDERFYDEFIIVKILPWSEAQALAFLSFHQLNLPPYPINKFICIPFYAQLYVSISVEGRSLENAIDEFTLIESFVNHEIDKIVKKLNVSKIKYYDFILNVAWRMRKTYRYFISEYELLKIFENIVQQENEVPLFAILKKSSIGYSFIHELFAEYLTASKIISELTINQNINIFGEFQTSYQEDMFISNRIRDDKSLLTSLTEQYQTQSDEILLINIVGMLSKVPNYDHIDKLIEFISNNKSLLKRYIKAVINRITKGSSRINYEWNGTVDKDLLLKLTKEIQHGTDPIATYICLYLIKNTKDFTWFEKLCLLAEQKHNFKFSNLLNKLI